MKHKHDSQHDGGSSQYHASGTPQSPLHVKLVTTEHEGAPQPHGFNERGNTEKNPPKWWGMPDWWVATGTVALAIFAVGSFILLWLQLRDARDFFISDQRPFIWISQPLAPTIKLGEKLAWNYTYTNFGKSPAIGVALRCQVRLQAHMTPELPDMYSPIHVKGHESEGDVIPPNDRTNWGTCYSQEVITEEDLKVMNEFDGGAKLVLFFEYYDGSRDIYTSTICYGTRRPNSGSATFPCPAENKIK